MIRVVGLSRARHALGVMGSVMQGVSMDTDTFVIILLVIAAVAFALEVVGIGARVNLLALGLLAWVLAVLVPLL